MNDWAIAIVGAVLAAVLGLLVPRVWSRAEKRRRGPLRTSLSLSGMNPFASPQVFLVPEGVARPEGAPGTRGSRERNEWLEEVGVPLGWQTARVILRGQASSPVVITDLVPVVLDSSPPLDGWFVAPELGGGTEIRRFVVDLDEQTPRALLVLPPSDGQARLLESCSFTVSDTDIEHFEVTAFTTSRSYSWGIDVAYDDEGTQGVLQVRDERLHLSAVSADQQAHYQEVDGTWTSGDWGRGFADQTAECWRNAPHVR
jgi:hypothetical protein